MNPARAGKKVLLLMAHYKRLLMGYGGVNALLLRW